MGLVAAMVFSMAYTVTDFILPSHKWHIRTHICHICHFFDPESRCILAQNGDGHWGKSISIISTGGDAMTINLEEIYDRYRKADFTDRLYIYLQFPELRNDFLEIDQKEKNDPQENRQRDAPPRSSPFSLVRPRKVRLV